MPALQHVGLFGGTFDPVHIAHLVAATHARDTLALDRTLLVVAPDPWQKRDRVVAPAAVRFEMVEAAVADLAGLEASRIELERDGPTYTIDTVEALQRDSAVEIVLVVGADVARTIGTWHRAEELRERVTLGVVTRNGNERVAPEGWRVEHVAIPRIDVSSTDIRERVARGGTVDVLVPAAALRVLHAHALYTRS